MSSAILFQGETTLAASEPVSDVTVKVALLTDSLAASVSLALTSLPDVPKLPPSEELAPRKLPDPPA